LVNQTFPKAKPCGKWAMSLKLELLSIELKQDQRHRLMLNLKDDQVHPFMAFLLAEDGGNHHTTLRPEDDPKRTSEGGTYRGGDVGVCFLEFVEQRILSRHGLAHHQRRRAQIEGREGWKQRGYAVTSESTTFKKHISTTWKIRGSKGIHKQKEN
jgi:hypothetical protein